MGNKRGATTMAYFLFILIIAVVSFGVLLYFILSADVEELGVDGVCQVSVLTRATTPNALELKNQVPLKCSTKKICISDGGNGNCEQFAREKEIINVKLESDSVGAARGIEKTIADSMLYCWRTMGEGKLDLMGQEGGFEKAEPRCVICSRIALDKGFVNKNYKNVRGLVDINKYLENHEAPNSNGKSYLSVFSDESVRAYGSFREDIANTEGKITNEYAVLFAQINTNTEPLDAAGKVVTGGFVLGGGALLTSFGRSILGSPLGALGAITGIGAAATYAGINQRNNQIISAGYCGQFKSSVSKDDKLRKGCSIVTVVDYSNVEKINELCKGGIEGSP